MPSTSDSDDWETSSEDSEPTTPVCGSCEKSRAELQQPLKRCAKCHSQYYCSRECQKDDWDIHKKICRSSQQNRPKETANIDGLPRPMGDIFRGLGSNDYLHQFSEKDAFCQLIDCYRMRIEDNYTFAGDACGLYAGQNPLPDFRRFLNLAEKRKGVLPLWWSPAKRKECERQAVVGKFSNLNGAVEKHDIVENYGDPLMPMKLRSLAEKIYRKKTGMGW